MSRRERVVVGLSGGIDSTAAVCRLQAAGAEVVGLTLRLRSCTEDGGSRRSCCGPDAAGMAARVAAQLGIRHYVLDCAALFEREVLWPCWQQFAAGRTPNPCVWCNARVRFPKLLEFAQDLGAAAAATGHYARVDKAIAGPPLLRRGVDPRKDQSYFLYAVDARLLPWLRFPLGGLLKTEVRADLRARGLVNAERLESQDICVADAGGSFAESLRVRFGAAAVPGEIRERGGRTLGTHAGIHRFTIGQRRGLGIAAGRPVRVCSIDPETGTVEVTADPQELLAASCAAEDCRWPGGVPGPGARLVAQVRYQQRPLPAVVEQLEADGGGIRVRFETPVAAAAPGQSLVLYAGDIVCGGGVLTRG